MIIRNLEQKSAQWHQWRNEGIGSSDIVAIVGSSPYNTPRDIYQFKKGLKESPKLDEGLMMVAANAEDDFREKLHHTLQIDFVPMCAESSSYSKFRSSFDGISLEAKKILEVKYSGNAYVTQLKEKKHAAIRKDHYYQCQWHLMVSGFDSCYYGVVSPSRDSIILEIKKDVDTISFLVSEALKFCELLDSETLPELKESEAMEVFETSEDMSGEVAKAMKKIAELTAAKDKLDEELELLKAQVKCLGHGNIVFNDNGTIISAKKSMREGTIAYAKVVKDLCPNADLSKYKGKPSEVWTFRINKE